MKIINNQQKTTQKKEPKNHRYLKLTNIILLFPIVYFIFLIQTKICNHIEYILTSLLVLTIFFSQLFWDNPIKNSIIHKIDAIIAKIVIFSFIGYTLLYKFKYTYLLILIAITTSFYYSNHFSSQLWCSNKHLICHGLLHFFCFIATFYAFV